MRATILMADSYLADDWLPFVTLYDLGYKPREHYAPLSTLSVYQVKSEHTILASAPRFNMRSLRALNSLATYL